MKNRTPENEPSRLCEWLQMALALGAIVLLFAIFSGGPFVLSRNFGVWSGLGGAVVAMIGWVYLVPPMPSLMAGLIALSGVAALAGLLIVWIVRVIGHVAA